MSQTKQPHADSQKKRWLKYGTNVAIVSLVAIAICALVVAISQMTGRRLDTTSQRIYSLKPQTQNVLRDLKGKLRIVSLYSTQTKPDSRSDPEGRFAADDWPSYVQTVSDLLQEYKRTNANIDVELIDPVNSPAKVDGLIAEVTSRYGGEVKKYQGFIDQYPKQLEQIKKMANEEATAIGKLSTQEIANQDVLETLQLSADTVAGFPPLLDRNQEAIQKILKQKPPDYKGAVDVTQQAMDTLSAMLSQIIDGFEKLKADVSVPPTIRQYMVDSTPRYAAIKKSADDLLKQIKDLGELKLDDLRQSLRQQNTILVLGQSDLKVIPFNKVWQEPADMRGYASDVTLKPRFAGEQQVTSAIVSLTREKKQRVVIVRPDGAPLASPGFPPFVPGGPMSQAGARLTDLNYEVLEKDLSGTYAMQAQMQQMPSAPDATDEQMKDALWVVMAFPASQQRNPMMQQPPAPLAQKLQEHLDAGGSAVVLISPGLGGEAPDLSAALKPRGIVASTNAVIVHEAMQDDQQTGDQLDQARRLPFIFDINQYGDTLMTRPLRSLASLMVPLVPVSTEPAKGYTVTPIIPIPQNVKTWGETDIDALSKGQPSKFDPAVDQASPGFAGAISQAEKGGRLVVIGSPTFMFNRYLEIPEPTLARRGTYVSRFPGNAELFVNSVLWASGQDALLAISPAAMEVSRLRDMGNGELAMVRVLIVGGIPAIVLLAGVMVYLKRRD